MPNRKRNTLLALALLAFVSFACNALSAQVQPTSTAAARPILIPTQSTKPVSTQSSDKLPLTEAEVPRVPVDVAKAAFDTGQAILVDVPSADAYAASHAKGAMNIPLGEIETNPNGLSLDQNQWIITYCT